MSFMSSFAKEIGKLHLIRQCIFLIACIYASFFFRLCFSLMCPEAPNVQPLFYLEFIWTVDYGLHVSDAMLFV
jgi:hypothetical protein